MLRKLGHLNPKWDVCKFGDLKKTVRCAYRLFFSLSKGYSVCFYQNFYVITEFY